MALTINSLLDVHCFEPSKDTFQVLSQLQASFPSVRCNNIGLWSAPGEAQLFVFAPGSASNSLYRRIGINSADHQIVRETVQIDTFDNYCHGNKIEMVDFVKVDVEGHELEVFNGMCCSLRDERVGIVQFEYGGCNIDSRVLLKDLFAFFSDYRYLLFKIMPTCVEKHEVYSQRLENFQYQNWIAVRSDVGPTVT